jgi:hypothetical protein
MSLIAPKIAPKVLPQSTPGQKTISLRRILPGLLRADVLRRLVSYGTLCGLMVSALLYCGSTGRVFAAGPERVGLPWDWSHEHLLFSQTDDPAVQAIIQKDPRAFHQWLRRSGAVYGVPRSFDSFVQSHGAVPESQSMEEAVEPRAASGQGKTPAKSDWGVSLGATQFVSVNSVSGTPIYPAKYTFDVNAAPNCITDYAVFPTGAHGATATNLVTPNGQASIVALNNLYSAQGVGGGLCNPPAGPLVYWAYVNAACTGGAVSSSDPILSSPVLSQDGTKVAWVTTTGKVQIVTFGSGFTLSGPPESVLTPACIGSNTIGGDNATLQTLTLANATHNPTSGVTISEIFVDFNTDSAYVGDDDGYLHKISPFFTASGALQEVTTPAWQASHAYSIGNLIVDRHGFIEQCTTAGTSGSGTPGWTTTWNSTLNDNGVVWQNLGSGGGWPVYVTASSGHTDSIKLNGPIFDSVSRNIFIGGQNGSLYYVLDPGLFTGVGACANTQAPYPCVGKPSVTSGITPAAGSQADCAGASPGPTCMVMSNQEGFTDPLVVDSSHKLVLAQFSNADGTNAKVEQTSTALNVFHSATLSSKANSTAYHSGAFDNTYYSTPGSGYYYLCAPAADGTETDLYRVSFSSTGGTVALGSKNGTPLKLTTTGTSGNCSPLTEFYNPNNSPVHDWLYLSLDNHATACASGSCVLAFTLAAAMVGGAHNFYGQGVSGEIQNMNGTGGMIVDNDANTTTYPQTSNIYFTPVSNTLTCGDGTSGTGCAVKLSQAGLH